MFIGFKVVNKTVVMHTAHSHTCRYLPVILASLGTQHGFCLTQDMKEVTILFSLHTSYCALLFLISVSPKLLSSLYGLWHHTCCKSKLISMY